MKINDHYLMDQLKHVFWITGGCSSGETTMTRKFVNELGCQTLAPDLLKYKSFTNPVAYPALQLPDTDFSGEKSVQNHAEQNVQWLFKRVEETLEFFVIDLVKTPPHQPLVIDLGIMPEQILPFIPKERVVCLYTSHTEIERLANSNDLLNYSVKTMLKFTRDIRNACEKSGIKTIARTPDLSMEAQFRLVREHFGL